METLGISLYYTKTVNLGEHDQLTLFLVPVLFPGDHHEQVFVSEENVPHLCIVVWKAASVTRVPRSGMFDGENAVKKLWRNGKKLSSQSMVHVYFV